MIYFLVSEDGALCKIGYTAGKDELRKRLKSLQTSYPWEFYTAISGTREEEGKTHDFFANLRHSKGGEQFWLREPLTSYLEWLGTRAWAATTLEDVDLDGIYEFPYRFAWCDNWRLVDRLQMELSGFDSMVPGLRKPRSFSQRVAATIRSDSDEWYTPPLYIESARAVMGGIDLDPASCALANRTVRATHIFTEPENGLRFEWHGKVWLNPPYGDKKDKFVEHLIREYEAGRVEQGIMCLNAHATDTVWFQQLWQFPICFTHHRIRFWGGQPGKGPDTVTPTTGTAFVYVGPDSERFVQEFRLYGPVVISVAPASISGEDFRRRQGNGEDWEMTA